MAGHKYLTNKLFDDEEEDDDTNVNSYNCRARIPATQSKPATTPYDGHVIKLDPQRQALLERQRVIEQRTLDSTNRSKVLLCESEQVGVDAAVKLKCQGEQLKRTNKRLDEMNTNLNTSQKHINGIKSVFHGFKNYISGKLNDTPARSQPPPDTARMKGRPSGSGLVDTIPNFNNDIITKDQFNAQPSARLRGLDQQTMAEPGSDSQSINKMIEENLEGMLHHVTKLKGLGVDLGRETSIQNELIDNIQVKVEVVDIKINKQNKAINKLLGK